MITIRNANRTDIDIIYSIECKAYKSIHFPYFFFIQALDFTPDLFLVIENNGKVVGFILCAINLFEKECWILDIAFDIENQSQGLGTKILQYSINKIKELAIKNILLHVKPQNVIAIGLYSKLGFKVKETRSNYFGEGEDRYIMELVINL